MELAALTRDNQNLRNNRVDADLQRYGSQQMMSAHGRELRVDINGAVQALHRALYGQDEGAPIDLS